MKNIKEDLVGLMKSGYCTPRIIKIAKKLKAPSATIHYNLKQMEKEGIIKAYKAVFDYKKINEGFCSYILVNLSHDEYTEPGKVAKEFSAFPEVESVDIITGEWEILMKVMTADIDSLYIFVKAVLSRKGIEKTTTLNSLKQIKSEFVEL